MNRVTTIIVLAVAFLAVFLEATFNEFRRWLGLQVDLLPGLMVYVSLSYGLNTVALVAVCGGLWFDALSANPLGVSVLPLFVVGWVIQRYRGLILRDQTFAQMFLGLAASAIAPTLVLALLINLNRQPLVGWFSFIQLLAMAVFGAFITPVWFAIFDRLHDALVYRPLGGTSFRLDREIKRGRQ